MYLVFTPGEGVLFGSFVLYKGKHAKYTFSEHSFSHSLAPSVLFCKYLLACSCLVPVFMSKGVILLPLDSEKQKLSKYWAVFIL